MSTPKPDRPAAPSIEAPMPLTRRFGFLGRYVALHLIAVPVLLSAIALALQYSPADMAISSLFVDGGHGFTMRESPWLELLGHEGARLAPMLVGVLALAGGIAGFGVQRLRSWRLVLLSLGIAMVVSTASVNWLKTRTTQQCPTSMQEFGGDTPYAQNNAKPFWARSRADAGNCLPSGHAGGGFSLLALYFAGWAAGRPHWRRRGLAIGVAAGVLFGIVRIVQGAHFPSATVWSAVVCWTLSALVFLPLLQRLSSPRD